MNSFLNSLFPLEVEEKEKIMQELFKKDDTFIIQDIYSKKEDSLSNSLLCKIAYINGMSSIDKISEMIIKPIQKWSHFEEVILNANIKEEDHIDKAIQEMLSGNCLVLVPHQQKVYIVDTKQTFLRGIEEPSNEKILKGPKDGFVENLLVNISLVRSHLKNHLLKIRFMDLGGKDHGKIALLYLEETVDYQVLNEVQKRLNKVQKSIGLDMNILKEKIRDCPYSPFKTIGDTERPDVACFKLLEGKVVLLMDGTPNACTIPFLFVENFHAVDDYYVNYFYGSLNRFLRFLSFILTVSIPAFYVAFLMYHQELLPTKLALSISASRQGVPFPTVIECLLLLTLFEILRESGAKSSALLGTSLSVVGALIIGQATVEARMVSTSVIIIVAITAVSGLIAPKLSSAFIAFRLLLLLFAAILGVHGLIIAASILLIHLAHLKSFNQNYFTNILSLRIKKDKDTFIRKPIPRGNTYENQN